jgi:hypothetical protein
MKQTITNEQWNEFGELGYVNLGKLLSEAELDELRRRVDDIMLGTATGVDYDRMIMQLDTDTGAYADMRPQTRGHKGAILNYRKIQDLEFDPLFLAYMQRPIFREICRRVYGDMPIACFRAMFMNKPARRGTCLPWHQDRWVMLDRDPVITLWTALDPATVANGCVQVIPRSHKKGLINPDHDSGFLTRAQMAEHAPDEKRFYLELKPGECALLHNWLLHASDVNRTDIPRRAFSVCYMPASTRSRTGNERFTTIFDDVDQPAAAGAAAGT